MNRIVELKNEQNIPIHDIRCPLLYDNNESIVECTELPFVQVIKRFIQPLVFE